MSRPTSTAEELDRLDRLEGAISDLVDDGKLLRLAEQATRNNAPKAGQPFRSEDVEILLHAAWRVRVMAEQVDAIFHERTA